MSVEALHWAWRQKVGGGNRMLVLVAVADAANHAGECWYGQGALAEKTGAGARTVWAALDWLEARGLIEREARHRKNGSRTSDLIRLPIGVASSAGRTVDHSQVSHSPLADLARPPEPKEETSVSPPAASQHVPLTEASDEIDRVIGELREACAVHGCELPARASVASTLAAYPGRAAAKEARELAHWAIYGPGRAKGVKAMAQTFRNWMKNADPAPPRSSERSKYDRIAN